MKKVLSVLAGVTMTLAAALPPVAPAQAAEQPCAGYTSSTSSCVVTPRTVAGTTYSTRWYLPQGTASALMVLNHGFSRSCSHLGGTSRAVAEKGVMVLCVEADMTAGNPALGRDLAATLASSAVTPPGGRALPQRIVVGGHSAGGHFAGVVGAELAERAPARLAGAILFDPVAAEGFSDDLAAVSAGGTRPVLSVAARLVWTSYTLGWPTGGSCRTDVEGENTDIVGSLGAGCSPHATQTARLREFASAWARDLATGTRTAAYWCGDVDVVSTCGRRVRDLVDRSLPLAAPIR